MYRYPWNFWDPSRVSLGAFKPMLYFCFQYQIYLILVLLLVLKIDFSFENWRKILRIGRAFLLFCCQCQRYKFVLLSSENKHKILRIGQVFRRL